MVNKERREENGERKKLEKEEWTIQYEDKRMENEEWYGTYQYAFICNFVTCLVCRVTTRAPVHSLSSHGQME